MRKSKRLVRLMLLQDILGFHESGSSLREIDIDKGIYPLVLLANLSGNFTSASCSGHKSEQLRCWRKSEGIHRNYVEGGYLDITPHSEQVIERLKEALQSSGESFHMGRDVWIRELRGVGLEVGWEECRISWCLPYRRGLLFIEYLEFFFIQEIKMLRSGWKRDLRREKSQPVRKVQVF